MYSGRLIFVVGPLWAHLKVNDFYQQVRIWCSGDILRNTGHVPFLLIMHPADFTPEVGSVSASAEAC